MNRIFRALSATNEFVDAVARGVGVPVPDICDSGKREDVIGHIFKVTEHHLSLRRIETGERIDVGDAHRCILFLLKRVFDSAFRVIKKFRINFVS